MNIRFALFFILLFYFVSFQGCGHFVKLIDSNGGRSAYSSYSKRSQHGTAFSKSPVYSTYTDPEMAISIIYNGPLDSLTFEDNGTANEINTQYISYDVLPWGLRQENFMTDVKADYSRRKIVMTSYDKISYQFFFVRLYTCLDSTKVEFDIYKDEDISWSREKQGVAVGYPQVIQPSVVLFRPITILWILLQPFLYVVLIWLWRQWRNRK